MLIHSEGKGMSGITGVKMWSLLAGAIMLMAMPAPCWSATSKVGSFTVVAGSVDALREQQDAPVAAEIGMDTFLNDVVRTKHRSRTQLHFVDDSVLNMGPDFMVKIKEYVYDEENGVRKAILSSLRGTVRATVAKLGADADSVFEIETPTAVASVRGTDFIVRVNSLGMTEVIVLEGAVAVRNVNPKIVGTVMVTAGKQTSVPKNSPPSPPVVTPVAMQKVLIAATTPSAGGQGSTTGSTLGKTSAQASQGSGGSQQPPAGSPSQPAPPPQAARVPVAPPPPPPAPLPTPVVSLPGISGAGGGGTRPGATPTAAPPVQPPPVAATATTSPVSMQLLF